MEKLINTLKNSLKAKNILDLNEIKTESQEILGYDIHFTQTKKYITSFTFTANFEEKIMEIELWDDNPLIAKIKLLIQLKGM
jgi:phage head maturation protease